ncbi:acetylesterase [Coraliomargarita sinensis]|uniref:Acetylesterase n=2 Tax=Coraliomargarita sinensis TaxID=2174842 RepID=A0A317ZGQ3_9BACT|nr:acetylesterase [Coraliomargarita sinensis]
MSTTFLSLCARFLGIFVLAVLFSAPTEAARKQKMDHPDLTKGESIPEGATHDWNLGATGARGWMYSENLTTSYARQVAVTVVAEDSPAEGVLEVGDVILGVAGQPFSYDPREEFGRALTAAETPRGGGELELLRWRDGRTEGVRIQLPVLGAYSDTAPYGCAKSKVIFEQGCEALAKRMAKPDYKGNPITRSLNALALLASGKSTYFPVIKKEAEWAAQYSTKSMATWWYGYVIMFLAEYVMITDDQSVMPGLQRLAMEAAEGQSIVGSWGHKFAGQDGRLVGYGMMNAPGLPLTTSLVLARKAGVDDPVVQRAIERSAKLLRFYTGKGAVPYGDHSPWIQTHEDNGKCSMAAVLFSLLDEPEPAKYFNHMSVAAHGAERDYGHTGNFWNITWAMPGVAQGGPHATGAWMDTYGAWYYDLARRWDGSFLHQGPPQMRGDKTKGWDASGAFLLAYAMPLKSLVLTGREGSYAPQMDPRTAQSLIEDGKGWTRHDRHSFHDALSQEELLDRLDSWSPVVRERAAEALARRKGEAPMRDLIRKLESGRLESRIGACQTFIKLGKRSAPAFSELRETLHADDLWLRVKAAEAIAAMGDAGMPALPDLLERVAEGPREEDPRGMEQRFLSFTVFGKMLKKHDLENVDKDLLRKAVAAGLKNEDGRARSSFTGIYQQLSIKELEPLLPAIYDAIVKPAPSGIMFADGIRLAGLHLFADHNIKQAIPLCLDLMDIQRWNKRSRINSCLDALEKYGSAAKPMLPRLRQLEKDLMAHWEAKGLQPIIERVRKMIKDLEESA